MAYEFPLPTDMTDISAISQAEIPFVPQRVDLWENPPMDDSLEKLRERLREALDDSGMSARALSLAIGANHSYVSQLMDGKGGRPSSTRVTQMARELDVSADWLLGTSSKRGLVQSEVTFASDLDQIGSRRSSNGPQIPLIGTGDCAALEVQTEAGDPLMLERSSFDAEYHVRYIARPPALMSEREAYAIYFHGESMSPRFEPGEIGFAQPTRPPRPGDDVIVQLNDGNGHSTEVSSVIVKRLVRQTSHEITLEQFNPPVIFTLARSQVVRMHRILPSSEMFFR